MTQEPRSKRRRSDQPERKTTNLTFRTRPQLRATLEEAAQKAHRSVSEQAEYLITRAIEWERVLGDLEVFKQNLANAKTRAEEGQRQTEEVERLRAGWGRLYDPNLPGGVRWFAPGTHNLPQSGFVDPNAPPSQPALPPVLREAVRAEVQSAVREILEEAGLLSSKRRSGGSAA
jgi:hypothetical protein